MVGRKKFKCLFVCLFIYYRVEMLNKSVHVNKLKNVKDKIQYKRISPSTGSDIKFMNFLIRDKFES